jgi:hypothetical protein
MGCLDAEIGVLSLQSLFGKFARRLKKKVAGLIRDVER